MVVSATGGELACRCSKEQYALLMRVFSQNLAGGGQAEAKPVVQPAPTDSNLAAVALPHPGGDALGSETARSTAMHALTMSLSFALGAVALQLEDAEGSLVSMALRRLAVGYKSHVSGENEVELSCGAIEMCNAREGAGMRPLVWPESTLQPVPGAGGPPPPPQVQLVYTNEGGAT
eukprot:5758337-Prymnesium_polylepis.1